MQIAIPAGGEAEARSFYGEILGLTEVEKPANLQMRGGVWFQSPSIDLHLGVERDFRPARKAHVAFEVFGLDSVRQGLERAGYETAEDEPLPGYDRLYVSDPFGNRVEILESRDSD